MSDQDQKYWGDHLRSKYGIPYAMDILTTKEEIDADNLEDYDDTAH